MSSRETMGLAVVVDVGIVDPVKLKDALMQYIYGHYLLALFNKNHSEPFPFYK